MTQYTLSYSVQQFIDFLQGVDDTFLTYVLDSVYKPVVQGVKDKTLQTALTRTRRIRVSPVIGSARMIRGTCPVTGRIREMSERIFIQNKFYLKCSKEGGRVVRAVVQMRSFLIQHKGAHTTLNDSKFGLIHEQFIYLRNSMAVDPKA